jgi:hypothetical protein
MGFVPQLRLGMLRDSSLGFASGCWTTRSRAQRGKPTHESSCRTRLRRFRPLLAFRRIPCKGLLVLSCPADQTLDRLLGPGN